MPTGSLVSLWWRSLLRRYGSPWWRPAWALPGHRERIGEPVARHHTQHSRKRKSSSRGKLPGTPVCSLTNGSNAGTSSDRSRRTPRALKTGFRPGHSGAFEARRYRFTDLDTTRFGKEAELCRPTRIPPAQKKRASLLTEGRGSSLT
jgi:hypothetical protein